MNTKNLFSGSPYEATAYIRQINAWKKGRIERNDVIKVGKAGAVLKALNVFDFDIVLFQETLDKATRSEKKVINGHKGHAIPIGIIKAIPEFINNHLMIFKSRTQKNSLVIFTNAFDKSQRPVIIALHLDKRKGRIIVNEIASIYGRNNDIDFLKNNIKENNLLYLDEKRSLKWGTRRGLQLSPLVHPNSGYINKVLRKEDIVNKIVVQKNKKRHRQGAFFLFPAEYRPLPVVSVEQSHRKPRGKVVVPHPVESDICCKEQILVNSQVESYRCPPQQIHLGLKVIIFLVQEPSWTQHSAQV